MKKTGIVKVVCIYSLLILLSLVFIESDATAKRKKKKTKEPAAPVVADIEVNAAVGKFLTADGSFDYKGLTVKTKDGLVTLIGSVDSMLAKRRTARVAETVKGVKSVGNHITVTGKPRMSREVFRSLDSILELYPTVKSLKVDLGFLEGKAYLSGVVDSYPQKMMVEEIALAIHGVYDVENKIDVSSKKTKSDSKIKSDFISLIKMDPYLYDEAIEIESSGGNVTLKGEVATAAEKSFAKNYAWLCGARTVGVNDLLVKWWIKESPKPSSKTDLTQDDKKIVGIVKKKLLLGPRTSKYSITVKSLSGRVYLGGVVDNLRAKLAAGSDAENTLGVWRVVNRIRVKPSKDIDDNELAGILKMVFESDHMLNPEGYTIAVRGGTAHLYGKVKNEFAVRRAGYIASMIDGVQKINNELKMENKRVIKTDTIVKAQSLDILKWDWLLGGDKVQLEVIKGEGVLSGKAQNISVVKNMVADIFRGGASKVKSDMIVGGTEGHGDDTFKDIVYFRWPFEW